MILHPWQEWVGRAVENLNGRRVRPERPMADQKVDRLIVVQYQMGLLHLKVLEEMTHAVATVERAANHVVQAEPGLSVFHHVLEGWRQVGWGGSYDWHG